MKRSIKIIFCVVMALVFFSCRKEAGPGGKNTISGTVHYKNGVSGSEDAASMAKIYITYGTDQSTSSSDQTILSNADGTYKIEGLKKGKYFVRAEYTDEHGFNYTGPDYGVEFNHRKKTANVDLVVE
jgi:hypothetical protein